MGACQSCLGKRGKDSIDANEEDPLIFRDRDGNAMPYGSIDNAALTGDDSAETQRENEALQRVVARTSSNMVDVFDVAPQQSTGKVSSASFAYSGQGARVARYQHLISKLSTEDDDNPAGVKVDWLSESEQNETQDDRPVSLKTVDSGDNALVGTFADAAAVAKR